MDATETAGAVVVVGHPLVQHKLTLMRDRDTSTIGFRRIAREISLLMAYEVTRDLPLVLVEIETPLERMAAPQISGKKLCFVSILRAGNGILDGMLDLVPAARVGHVGLYRDPQTLAPVEYYLKLPDDLAERLVVVVDPMLATGNSDAAHPDVTVFTASVDRCLNDHGYICPGLGDAGDRLYGTK